MIGELMDKASQVLDIVIDYNEIKNNSGYAEQICRQAYKAFLDNQITSEEYEEIVELAEAENDDRMTVMFGNYD